MLRSSISGVCLTSLLKVGLNSLSKIGLTHPTLVHISIEEAGTLNYWCYEISDLTSFLFIFIDAGEDALIGQKRFISMHAHIVIKRHLLNDFL